MKRAYILTTLAKLGTTGLLGAAAFTVRGQGWLTYPQGAFSPSTAAIQPNGTAAYAYDANNMLIRRGDAGGTIWTDASLPAVPSGYQWLATAANVAADPTGNVYLPGGFRNLSDGSRSFNVFESSDGALSWHSVFSVAYTSPRPPSEGAVGGLATASAGNLYLANVYFPGTPGSWAATLNYYRIRKGTRDPLTGGVAWSVVDDYPGSGELSYSPRSVTIRPKQDPAQPSEIWVAGSGIDAKTFKNPFPFVRRSLDGGATWASVSAWPVPSGYSPNSGQIVAGADINGLAYVCVSYQAKVGKTVQNYWLTYRSANQGASWTLVDTLASASGPSGLAADALGGVFIAGNGSIRASVDGGNTWVTPNLPGANCVAADLVGDVLVGGSGAIYKLRAP